MMIRYYGKAAKPSNLLASRVQVDILLRKELLLLMEEKERERAESNECTGEKNLLLKNILLRRSRKKSLKESIAIRSKSAVYCEIKPSKNFSNIWPIYHISL